MAWCLTAPSHYLNQCWGRSMLSHGVTRPQWVNEMSYLIKTTSLDILNQHAPQTTFKEDKLCILVHWGWVKMAYIWQMTFQINFPVWQRFCKYISKYNAFKMANILWYQRVNFYCARPRLFQAKYVNTMAADDLVPGILRPLSATLLTR